MDLSKLKGSMSQEPKEVQDAPAPEPETTEEEKKYQHYASSKIATRMITPTGRVINFVNFKFITADPELMSYLDGEIASGMNVISKGELLTHKEADPMTAYKQRVIDEYLAEQAEKAKLAPPPLPEMGNTKTQEAIEKSIKPATSYDVAAK